MISFTIYGKPQGKARARTFYNQRLGRSQSITPEKTVLYENQIKQAYLEHNEGKYYASEPLIVSIYAIFEVPKSITKKDREKIANGHLHPTKKPDADNIAKVICDALNGIAYKDDTQIVSLKITKRYTFAEPRVVVDISSIEEERTE